MAALGRMGGAAKRAIPVLTDVAGDADEPLAAAARQALKAISPQK